MQQREPKQSVLPYEPREEERRRFWNVGNVSVVTGTALLLSIWIGVPALTLGETRMRDALAPFGFFFFAVWMAGPAFGAVMGIIGIVRRTGGSSALGLVVNLACWPVLVLMCWVCLIRGR